MDYVAPHTGVQLVTVHKRLSWLRRLALLTTFWALIVIMYGAYTRLVDAGLGCPDWPGCYGFLSVPTENHEILVAESRFPHAPVETEKGWPEMVHRYLASTLGLLIFALAALAWKRHESVHFPRRHTVVLTLMVILQGMFGMWTVTLKLWPQVVSSHLLGGFTTFCLLSLLVMRLWLKPLVLSSLEWTALRKTRPVLGLAIVLLICQISLGAWVSSNYAAVACPDFPTCQEKLWPAMDFKEGFNLTQEIGPNYLGGKMDNEARVAIHMAHRIGAVAVTVALLVALVLVRRASHALIIRRLTGMAAILLCIQISLGITNVVALLPLSVAVAHNAVAAILLVSLIWLFYRIWTAHNVDTGGEH
jgi:heme a synthase